MIARWVTWQWEAWFGKDVDYSVPHLVDPSKCTQRDTVTACGLKVGRIVTENKTYDVPPKGACAKCHKAWRTRTDL
jgi:hypothetical protein